MTCEACFCSVCAPTGAPAQCSACGEEIRLGYRDGKKGWWHREAVDHAPIHGHRMTWADVEESRRQREDVIRYTDEGEPYTTAEYEIKKDPDKARRRRRLAALKGEDPDYVEPIPEPEMRATPVEVESLPPRSGMRQIANLVVKTEGWELRRLTAARGPYVGGDGSVLSISDSLVLGARGQELDGGVAIAVASWRDGKFDHAYAGVLKDGVAKVDPVNATELKTWIKETV